MIPWRVQRKGASGFGWAHLGVPAPAWGAKGLRQPLRRALILPWAGGIIQRKTHKNTPMATYMIRVVVYNF